MDSKVLTTLAILVGVLAVLYFVTDSKSDSDVEVRTETVSVEETHDELHHDEEITEMPSEEVLPSGGDEEYSEVNMMEETSVEEAPHVEETHHSEEAPQQEAELTFQKKDFNVSGYGGSDYSSF